MGSCLICSPFKESQHSPDSQTQTSSVLQKGSFSTPERGKRSEIPPFPQMKKSKAKLLILLTFHIVSSFICTAAHRCSTFALSDTSTVKTIEAYTYMRTYSHTTSSSSSFNSWLVVNSSCIDFFFYLYKTCSNSTMTFIKVFKG